MMVALVMAVVVVVMMIHDGGVVAQELLICVQLGAGDLESWQT